MQHGAYSKFLKGSLAENFKAAKKMVGGMDDEIALLRAFVLRTLQFLGTLPVDPSGQFVKGEILGQSLCRQLVRDIADINATMARIEQTQAITPAQVSVVVSGIIMVLEQELTPEQLKRVTDRLAEVPWPSGVNVEQSPSAGRNAWHRRAETVKLLTSEDER